MRSFPLALAVAVVAVSGCSTAASTVDVAPAAVSAPVSVSTPPPVEHPVTVQVTSVRLLRVGPAAADKTGRTPWSRDIPGGVTLVRVAWTLRNTTRRPVVPVPAVRVVYGPNAVPAQDDLGWMGQDVLWPKVRAEQVGAGATLEQYGTWQIPSGDVPHAALRVTDGTGENIEVPLSR